jgi:hypothetical protein
VEAEWMAPPVAADGLNGLMDPVWDGGRGRLCGYNVSLETGGTFDISVLMKPVGVTMTRTFDIIYL